MEIKKPKIKPRYLCKYCDFKTNHTNDYDRHCVTAKHRLWSGGNDLEIKKPKKTQLGKNIKCECGKIYLSYSGWWKHSKKCEGTKEPNEDPRKDLSQDLSQDLSKISTTLTIMKQPMFTPDIVHKILLENQEFKQMLVEQKSQIIENQNQIIEQQSQIIELSKKPTKTTNNNQKFNLNFFLNDTCKDAMNIKEFIEMVKSNISFKDLEYIAKHGYIAGQTKVITENLNSVDLHKRPIHCTDVKRKTVHVKAQDEWKKEEGEPTTILKMMDQIEHRENQILCKWVEENPTCYKHDSPQNETYMNISQEISKGVYQDNQSKVVNEVIHKVIIEK